MAAKGDVEMVDVTVKAQDRDDYTNLLVLELYNQLQELELQQSLLQAQQSVHVPDVSMLSDDVLQEQLTIAQQQAMEAKAEYEIRNRISRNVLVMDPVLKAVHGGEQTGFGEKRLLPLITESDTVSLVHGMLSAKLASSTHVLQEVERANIIANKKNRELSHTLLGLVEEMKSQSAKDVHDAQLRKQMEDADEKLRDSRRKTKTLKGVLSAMIVGSGINWAADQTLTEHVMDADED